MTNEKTRHFGERVKVLYQAFNPTGYGAYVPWFYRMTLERAPLNVDLRTVYRWAKSGKVPPNKHLAVENLIGELVDEKTEQLHAEILALDDLL